MKISVSSTLTLYHDGQFWVGIVEHVEDGRLGVARIVFGVEPSDEEVLRFVVEKWQALMFGGSQVSEEKPLAKNPKRRQREALKTLKHPTTSTKAQMALSEQREASKRDAKQTRRRKLEDEKRTRFEQRSAKRKEKRRGH